MLMSHATDWRRPGFLSSKATHAKSDATPAREQGKRTTMPTGTVKFFNTDKGYGFIHPEDGGNDAFVHISAVERAGLTTLNKDQRVTYELETDRSGRTSAVNIQSA
jgi:cold shock protein